MRQSNLQADHLKIALPHETAGSGSFPVFLLVKFGLFACMFVFVFHATMWQKESFLERSSMR